MFDFSYFSTGISLVILNPEQSVMEAGLGNVTSVTSCFSVNLSQPLIRGALFELDLLGQSTAEPGFDFIINSSLIFVPGDFIGVFFTCINFTIFGDLLLEGNETIVYDIVPRVDVDTVAVPGVIRIDILDNDNSGGEHYISWY